MQGLVSMCAEQLQEHAGQLSFACVTFTECGSTGCYTSLYETTSAGEMMIYMSGINLCSPPKKPWCHANG